METPTQRTLKIGKATIGLIGLDIALNRALAEKIPVHEAPTYLFSAIQGKNYIPTGMETSYKEALLREYKKLLGHQTVEENDLTIRIFGSGCVTCNTLRDAVIDAMMQSGVAADIDMIYDPDEIGRQGIVATPALMINGKLKIAGLSPTPVQLNSWLQEAAGK